MKTSWQPQGPIGPTWTERCVYWTPGYDCTQKCEHDRKGQHGVHGDELMLVVRGGAANVGDGLQEAAALVIYTNVRKGEYAMRPFYDKYKTMAAEVALHCSYPTDEEAVRLGPGPGAECTLVDGGRCFLAERRHIVDDIWLPEDDAALGDGLLRPDAAEFVLEGISGAWERLTKYFHEAIKKARVLRAELPVQCPHCHGNGVVPRSGLK